MPTSLASACPGRERRPFRPSLALSAITKSAFKGSSTQKSPLELAPEGAFVDI